MTKHFRIIIALAIVGAFLIGTAVSGYNTVAAATQKTEAAIAAQVE